MTNTQHTPGPWILGHNVSHEPTVRSDDPGRDNGGFVICQTFGTGKQANARLIAAAPEMLAALIDAENALFRALEDHTFDSPADSAAVIDALVIVRASIAKATAQI